MERTDLCCIQGFFLLKGLKKLVVKEQKLCIDVLVLPLPCVPLSGLRIIPHALIFVVTTLINREPPESKENSIPLEVDYEF